MERLKNDTLGFEQFKIDEQLSSLFNQILGGYARMTFKVERKNSSDTVTAFKFQTRFKELGMLKSEVKYYTYSQKVVEINKFQEELKDLLETEKTL